MIDLSDVVRQLYVATKPLLLSGGGVQMTADVLDEVQRKSELLGAPVANTYLQDCLPADDAMAYSNECLPSECLPSVRGTPCYPRRQNGDLITEGDELEHERPCVQRRMAAGSPGYERVVRVDTAH